MKRINKLTTMLVVIIITFVCIISYNIVLSDDSVLLSVCPEIKNHSFENQTIANDGSGMATISDWIFLSEINYGQADFVAENAYDGERYYELKNNEYIIQSSDYIELEKNIEYSFGFKFKCTNLDDSCSITINTFDENNLLLKTIDGEEQKAVKENSWSDASVKIATKEDVARIKLTLKIKSNNGNVGIDYVYGNKEFIKLCKGASISLEENAPGIRFVGQIDKTIYDEFYATYDLVSAGMILMPTKYLDRVGEFTYKSIQEEKLEAEFNNAKYWNNQQTCEEDGYYGFNCALIDEIIQENIMMEFCVRGYIKYTENGVEKFIYSDFNRVDNSRSVNQVAIMARADTANFEQYDEIQKEIILAYAENRLPKFN